MNNQVNVMEDHSMDITQELEPMDILNYRNQQAGMWQESRGEIYGAMSTVIGGRESQQDSCYVDVEGGNAIGIVCDGMGGLAGGELASQSSVCMFVEDYEKVRYQEGNLYDFLVDEMVKLDDMVADLEDERGNLLSAGTTLVATSVRNGYLQWTSVGDSKIYIIRGSDMECLTKEHNYLMLLNERLTTGKIDEEEYAREVKKGAALISYLGMGSLRLVDINSKPFALENGDIILLCSDGLYKALSEQQILEIVMENPADLPGTLEKLQIYARAAAGRAQDNTSIVMLLYTE